MIVSQEGFIILNSPSLAERTTIRLGGEAIAEVRVSDTRCLEQLPELLTRIGGRICIMGEGSNIIAQNGKLPLLLLSMTPMDAPKVVEEKDDSVLLWAHGGMRLPALLSHAASMGLAGLEGICGIPGSVGGAVYMNAGSFGTEIGSLVHSVELFSPQLGLVERHAQDFHFSYRHCRLLEPADWFLISGVILRLTKGDKEATRARMREVYQRKQQSQPVTAWSAGCVFKNPSPEAPAGRLLDEAGLRGMRLGGMAFSSVHANFLVNEGEGSFEQAVELIDLAREKVRARTGHELELEVQIWP